MILHLLSVYKRTLLKVFYQILFGQNWSDKIGAAYGFRFYSSSIEASLLSRLAPPRKIF
jgi:hypothetical protein